MLLLRSLPLLGPSLRRAALARGLLVVSGVPAAACFLLPLGDWSIGSAVSGWLRALGVLGLLLLEVPKLLLIHCCSQGSSRDWGMLAAVNPLVSMVCLTALYSSRHHTLMRVPV
jgi:hypothetical protein